MLCIHIFETSYGFVGRTEWNLSNYEKHEGWLNNDIIFIFGGTCPFKIIIMCTLSIFAATLIFVAVNCCY